MSNANSSQPDPALPGWLGFLLAALVLSGLVRFGDSWPGIDFYQFWLVGRDVHGRHDADPYEATARAELGKRGLAEAREQRRTASEPSQHLPVAEYRQALEVYSTPLLYGTVGAVATDHYEHDKRNWQRAMLALYAVAVLLLGRAFGMGWGAACLCIAAFAMSSEPLLAELGNGNVNAVLLFSLSLCLLAWSRERYALGAMALGLGLCFKPLLWLAVLPVILRWAFARESRPLFLSGLGLGLGVVAGIALGAWLGGGFSMWQHWLGSARDLALGAQDYPDNFAPLARIERWFSLSIPGWLPPLAVLLIAGLRAWWRRGLAVRDAEACEWLAWGALLCLVISPLVWIHYLLLAIPLLMAAWTTDSGPVRIGAIVAGFCLASQPLTMLMGWREPGSRSLPVLLAMLLLVWIGLFVETPGVAAYAGAKQGDAK